MGFMGNIERVIALGFRPLSRGLFFNKTVGRYYGYVVEKFSSPLSGTFFQSEDAERMGYELGVFVPSLGDFFSIACLRNPSPSALASAFAAGMGESLHQALSFGDEMPIFPVRAGIGGDLS